MTCDTHQPNVDARGVPFCSAEYCCQYDGKRCRLTGFRPDNICEPAVVEMAERLAATGLVAQTVAGRLKRGWPVERALSEPPKPTNRSYA